MDDPPRLLDDVAAYELALRRGAGARAADGGDPALVDLHRQIRARRARRSAPGPERFGLGTRARRTTGDAPSTAPSSATPTTIAAAPGRIAAIEPYGTAVKVFRIGRPAGFTFRAGQYLKLGVPGGKREDFSIASAPHEPHLELAIELRPGGTVTPALFALRVGAAVDIGGAAKGGLRLDPDADHHLMVATVTGIAPLRSMILEARHTGTTASFTVLHGASYAAELCFHDELVALAADDARVRYIPTVSRPDEPTNRSWTGPTGRVDPLARMVAGDLDPRTTHVYAVGNAGMIKAVERDLGTAGFRISTESYGG